MSRIEAANQFEYALKAGKKYYRDAILRGEYPFPTVLDEIVDENRIASRVSIGLTDIPSDYIKGTKTAGRTSALAGNFMPLLDADTEFGTKWISLCEAHLGSQGIHDPILCYEYMGRFYVQEGNKRVSVLLSFDAPTVPGIVTRLIPEYSSDHEVMVYYEFLHFYELTGLYGITMKHRGEYARLLAELGMDDDHVWTEDERRRFRSGYTKFKRIFYQVKPANLMTATAEALLVWLRVFRFSDIKEFTDEQLAAELRTLMPDIRAIDEGESVELSTGPDEKQQSLLGKLFGGKATVKAAFIYPTDPVSSPWSRAHEQGRLYAGEKLEGRAETRVYTCSDGGYLTSMEQAADDGADIIFATTPPMIDACRNIALTRKNIKVLNCALSQSYTGVRTYYARAYESKFITGAIAGAMTENDTVGYIADYPIFGTIASVNAFALGLRATNPRARVALRWTCLPGEPSAEFLSSGIRVISNRDTLDSGKPGWAEGRGTYMYLDDGTVQPLAIPTWNWGRFYEKTIKLLLHGTWEEPQDGHSVSYWWGMDSGVIDISLDDSLPDGVRSLAMALRSGIISGQIEPFRTRIVDDHSILRNDGSSSLDMDSILNMDWFCQNVDGRIPSFDELLPMSRDLVRVLGIYRSSLPPEKDKEEQI